MNSNRTTEVNMFRKLTIAAVAMSLATGALLASAGPASADKLVIAGSGTVVCTGAGKTKVSPPLTSMAASGLRTLTSKLKMVCSGSTGNLSVSVFAGKMTAVTTTPASGTCSSLLGDHNSTTVADIKWKAAGGKLVPTHIVDTTWNATASGYGFPAFYTDPIFAPQSIATVTGSYHGEFLVAGFHAALPGSLCTTKGTKKLILDSTSGIGFQPL